jgi:hypothetical protein
MDAGVVVHQDLLGAFPAHTPGTQVPIHVEAQIASRPAAGSFLAHATAMPIWDDVRMGTDRVIYSDQVRLPTIDRAVANIGKEFAEGRQVIVGIGAIGDVVTPSNGPAHNPLIPVEVAAGTRVARIVREGGRREGFKGVRNEDLKLVRVIDGAPLADMPVGVGAGGDGLRLDGRGMERINRHFPGHYVQEIVGLDGNGDRIIGTIRIGMAGIANKCRTAIRGVVRGAERIGRLNTSIPSQAIHPNSDGGRR